MVELTKPAGTLELPCSLLKFYSGYPECEVEVPLILCNSIIELGVKNFAGDRK